MLRAAVAKQGRTYEITEDGRALTPFAVAMWDAGATLTLDGADYTLGSSGPTRTMTTPDGSTVATATRNGRRWTIEAGGALYRFRHDRLWGRGTTVEAGGRTVGTVARTNRWTRGGAEADLPGLPTPLQVFVLAVVLTMWRRQGALTAAKGPLHG